MINGLHVDRRRILGVEEGLKGVEVHCDQRFRIAGREIAAHGKIKRHVYNSFMGLCVCFTELELG